MKRQSLDHLLAHTLPLNRKERYFTGTVLPALLGGALEHLDRLAALAGVPDVIVRTAREDCTVLLFTEYGIVESAMGASRFSGLPTAKDTPDLVILVTEPAPVLIAVEAKMFDRPSRAELTYQLGRQADILTPLAHRLAGWLEVPSVRLVRIALLPEQLRATVEAVEPLAVPVITWQQIHEAWADIGGYYHQVLGVALDQYGALASPTGAHNDASMLGQELLEAARAATLPYPWMGRQGGFHGKAMRSDLEADNWRTTQYQVRRAELPGNPNWFPVASFVAAVSSSFARP